MTQKSGDGDRSRRLELALFATALIWAVAANLIAGRAAAGIAGRLGLVYGQSVTESVFLLFLVVIGFQGLRWVSTPEGQGKKIVNLPKRKTAAAEWGTGLAIGWGLCLAAVFLPLVIGNLHARINRGPGLVPALLSTAATLLILSLAEEVIFRGYPFQRLMGALGTGWAAWTMSIIFGSVLMFAHSPENAGLALLDGMLFGLLLAMAYLRTHALWLGWGLHFGYRVVMALVLGLPVAGRTDFGSLADTVARGPAWLSGGAYGPDAALLTGVVMVGGIAVLYRVSRNWSWSYTLPEIVPAGHEVTVAPPLAHVAMEKSHLATDPPLIQILPTTPSGFASSIPASGAARVEPK